ncbi:unnamed protein product [Fusarium graminearum]|uniref:Uncharacterized protein n=1 Tax=Gibberella zeae TaxID=5518 RepID=A0A4E9E1D0_GIBZA|nr:unnamed protein product [Fusarium graminearum]CAF3528623.1 unnamed protein product [Fusarium graminearum]CAG1966604.1 unnamed protein product [Fusarium graminearum]CAG2006709.1 unnamed protein product [Fusarium graminearum]
MERIKLVSIRWQKEAGRRNSAKGFEMETNSQKRAPEDLFKDMFASVYPLRLFFSTAAHTSHLSNMSQHSQSAISRGRPSDAQRKPYSATLACHSWRYMAHLPGSIKMLFFLKSLATLQDCTS